MRISLKALMIYVVSLFVFPFGFIVLPSYFIKLGLEKDNRLALISFGIFFVLSLVVSSPMIAIPVGLYIILVFYSILNLLSSGFNDTQAITISFVGICAFVVLTNLLLKLNADMSIADVINVKLNDFMKVLSSVKMDEELMKSVKIMFEQSSKLIVKAVYAILGLIAFYTSVLNVYIPQKSKEHQFHDFRIDMKFTMVMVALVLVSGIVYFVNKDLGNYLLYNLSVFGISSYLLGGIALMLSYLKSLSTPFKVLTVLVSVAIQPFIYILAFLGALNSFKDLRKKENNERA
ncbi:MULTISPECIES: DUF2232 domain-containing protein [Peptoniphilaceae]|uniref:DUF2232 domain-containing protein n=1 Tax=Peptoniphilaceae TaxID=1570339 RepID=UPI0028053011|nr:MULTISPECIES: DUF2232 domain-containing protein [Peptoniphilaceae]MDU4278231.1 DUF2232 domain-containing protein [Finegoldia magna]MDU5070758.1 DUF2232 domain-containing protein [Finegoldia magna]MDU7303365.1 DUF2232 domain-containing protein [Peptoniphilus lacydonensis]MDU7890703.1 DUF2232 domain-containing protein [Finegoldia magna]